MIKLKNLMEGSENLKHKKDGQNASVNKCCGCRNENTLTEKDKNDSCWDGYEQFGMKIKNGKKVPNCISVKKEQVQELLDYINKSYLEEAEYQGKKVTLNKPFRTPSGPKKFAVYVKNDKGNVIRVTFGDPNMEIKRDNPERRKAFRARHNCDDKKDKTTAGYWSCYQWRAGHKVKG